MRAITKGREPASLTAHRLTPHSDFDNYAAKDELRDALVGEQRGLCCYCMGRIQSEASLMKVEHWRCQNRFPDEQLSYRNLLGACLGEQGSPVRLQHCDTRKGSRDLRWNPAVRGHRIESRVKYDPDGTVRADDSPFDVQLNEVLNLNLPWLKKNRREVLTAILDWWRAERPVPRDRIQREIRKRTEGNGVLTAYCQVAVYWLSKKLKNS